MAVNRILTEQIQKEQASKEEAYENSLGRIVKYEKVSSLLLFFVSVSSQLVQYFALNLPFIIRLILMTILIWFPTVHNIFLTGIIRMVYPSLERK